MPYSSFYSATYYYCYYYCYYIIIIVLYIIHYYYYCLYAAGAVGTAGVPANVTEGTLARHMQSCLTLNHSVMFMGRYHLCLCLLCLRLMQELVAAQACLELTLKTYLPATCSLV